MAAAITKAKAVSEEYKSALADLTFNSKPMINVLTMLAEENNEYGQVIVQVICDRITKVGVDQKMPSLYLLDSILKNIGGEYVQIISKFIVEVFCHTFEAAADERKRMQLFKLRNTWVQYIPAKSLYDLDIRINRTDPNWPIIAPTNTPKPAPIVPGLSPKVHINPKFLAKNDINKSLSPNAIASSIVSSAVTVPTSTVNETTNLKKHLLLEEEKRVQEQLKILQAEKVKREREQHEVELKRQQQVREKLLAEQRRQLELLRKQQQNMTGKKKTPGTEEEKQNESRKRGNSGSKDPRLLRKEDKSGTTESAKRPKPIVKPVVSKVGALSVMNKIMTNMSGKKTKPSFATSKTTDSKSQPLSYADVNKSKAQRVIPASRSKNEPIFSKSKIVASNSSTSVSEVNHLDGIMNSMTQSFPGQYTNNEFAKEKKQDELTSDDKKATSNENKIPISKENNSVQRNTNVVNQRPPVTSGSIPLVSQPARVTQAQQRMNVNSQTAVSSIHSSISLPKQPTIPISRVAPLQPTIPISQPPSSIPTMEEVKMAQAVALASAGPPPVPPLAIAPAFPPPVNNLNSRDMQIAAQAAAIATALHQMSSGNQTQTTLIDQLQPVNQPVVNTQQSAELAAKLIQLISGQQLSSGSTVEQLLANNNAGPQNPAGSSDVGTLKDLSNRLDPKDLRKEHYEYEKRKEDSNKQRVTNRQDSPLRDSRNDREMKHGDMKRRDRVTPDRNLRERDRREQHKSNNREAPPERSRERSPYREHNRSVRPPNHERGRKEKRCSPDPITKGRMERNTLDSNDQSQQNKSKENFDIQGRSRKARARSPSRYWFRMERKIETEKRVEEKEKELHLQRFRKNSNGEHNEHVGPKGKPVMRKPHDVSSEEWFTYKKDRKKEFRYIKSRLLDIKRDIRDGVPDFDIDVLKEHRIEVNQKLKKGDITIEQYEELSQVIDNIYYAHSYRGEGNMEQTQFRNFPPRNGPEFNGIRNSTPYNHRERYPPPRMINDAMNPNRHPGPQFHMRHPEDQRFPRPPIREPFPPPRERFPPPRIENRPPFRPFHEQFNDLQSNNIPHPMPSNDQGPPRAPFRPPYPTERPEFRPQNMPYQQPFVDQPPHVAQPPHVPPLEPPPPVPRLNQPPRVPHVDHPPRIPHADHPPHVMRNPFPPPINEPRAVRYQTEQNHLPFEPRGQPPPQMNLHNILPVFPQNLIKTDQPQNPSTPETSEPLDISSLLGKLLAQGVIEKKVDLDVPKMKLNLEDLRKRHESIVNEIFQGMQCSSCGQRFPLNSKDQYGEHLDWHFRQNSKKDNVNKINSRTWFYDIHDWVEQIDRKVADTGKVQSAFFEAERATKAEQFSENVSSEPKMAPLKEQSIPVLDGDGNVLDGDGMCEICCEPLDQYWDEDDEEWRYRKAVREDNKTYHESCFEDYIPYEFEEDDSRPLSPSSSIHSPSQDTKEEFELTENLDAIEGDIQMESTRIDIEMNEEKPENTLKTENVAEKTIATNRLEDIINTTPNKLEDIRKATKLLEDIKTTPTKKNVVNAETDKLQDIKPDKLDDITEPTPDKLENITKIASDKLEDITEKTPEKLEDFSKTTPDKLEDITEKTHDKLEDITEKTHDKLEDITEKTHDKLEDITEKTPDKLEDITDTIPGKLEDITERTPDKPEDVIEKTPDKLEDMTETAPDKLEDIADTTPVKLEDITEKTADKPEDITEKTADKLEDVTEKRVDQLDTVADTSAEKLKDIVKTVKESELENTKIESKTLPPEVICSQEMKEIKKEEIIEAHENVTPLLPTTESTDNFINELKMETSEDVVDENESRELENISDNIKIEQIVNINENKSENEAIIAIGQDGLASTVS